MLSFISHCCLLILAFSVSRYEFARNNTDGLLSPYRALKNRLKNYETKAIPLKDGTPLNVSLQLIISDMNPTTESKKFEFSMNLYVRLYWIDYRLDYQEYVQDLHNDTSFTFDAKFDKSIWQPDLFFYQATETKLMNLTKLNKMVRIHPNGLVLASQRMQLTLACRMNLTKFPFDHQRCEVTMESMTYTSENIRLLWKLDDLGPVVIGDESSTFEFELDGFEYYKQQNKRRNIGFYDNLILVVKLSRTFNYYLLEAYFPLMLIVILSWVSFWISYKATKARASFCITTVLTATILGTFKRQKVGTIHALDWYSQICFLYVLACLLEYVAVGITHLFWLKKKETEIKKNESEAVSRQKQLDDQVLRHRDNMEKGVKYRTSESDDKEDLDSSFGNSSTRNLRLRLDLSRVGGYCSDDDDDDVFSPVIPEPMENQPPLTHLRSKNGKKKNSWTSRRSSLSKIIYQKQMKDLEVHIIDKISRYVFPISFVICNILYFGILLATHSK